MKKYFYIFVVLFFIVNLRVSADSPRKYVLESFTNTHSELCASANQNILFLMDRYSDNVIPITYHTSLPNENDFFYQNNKEIAKDRIGFYSKINTFPGVPYCILNGNRWFGNPNIQNTTKRNLDKLKTETSPISIDVSMIKTNSDYEVEVYINSSENLGSKRLFVLLMEYRFVKSEVPMGGIGNSEIKFKWIARKMLTAPTGDEINITKNNYIHFSEDFAPEENMKYNNLYAIAFVQDSATGEILQANSNFAPFACEIEPINGTQYRTIDPNSYDVVKFKLTNPNDFDVDYSVYSYSDNENLIVDVEKPVINIRAGQTQEITVNIGSKDKAFFGKAMLKVVPILKELPKYYGVKEEILYSIYYLSNNAKFATIYTSDYSISKVIDAVKSLKNYKTYWITMPSEIYLKGYSTRLFDVLYMLVHPDNAIDFSTDEKQVGIVAKHIENNKNVILTSPSSLSVFAGEYSKNNKYPSANLKTIFNKYLGIKFNSFVNRDINSYDTTYICGIPNNILSRELDTVGVQNNYPEIGSFETMDVADNSTATPFINYGNIVDGKNVAVFTKYDSSKIVYMGIGFEQFTQTAKIAQSLKNIMLWFGAVQYSKLLEVTSYEFDFIAEVGDSTSQSLFIRNVGSQDIKISNIYFTEEPFGFQIDTAPFIGKTIKAGDSAKIDINFKPNSDMNVATQMIIENESTNMPEVKINLFGYSYVSVEDEAERLMQISPNPADDFITISFSAINPTLKLGVDELIIYNTLGEIVMSVVQTPSSEQNSEQTGAFVLLFVHRMSIESFPKGIYFVKVGGETAKFLKM